MAQIQSLIQGLSETEQAEQSLHAFLRYAWPIVRPGREFVDGRHIHAICEHLEAVTRREILRLIINVPYRTSKSTIVSVVWPAWVWIKEPTHQWLAISHADRLAMRDTRDMRVLLASDWYQRQWPLGFASDQNEKRRFENSAKGHRIACGLGAGALDENADTIIIDDPIDRSKAASEQERQNANDDIDQKVLTRLNNLITGAVVMVMQRLHENDPTGHLLEQGGWDHLCLPMEYERNHPHPSKTSIGWTDWRTREGELMCPERFPREVVEREKRRGASFAAGQLQQRPAPKEGGTFKRAWFKTVKDHELPKFKRLVRYWDRAASDGEGDWSVGLLMGIFNKRFYVLDVVRGQWSAGERNRNILRVANQDKTKYRSRVKIFIEQEPGSGGKESAEIGVRELREAGHRAAAHKVGKSDGDKAQRADAPAGCAELGNMFMLEGDWNVTLLGELTIFPNGSHDDQVDAFSGAWHKLQSGPSMLTGL